MGKLPLACTSLLALRDEKLKLKKERYQKTCFSNTYLSEQGKIIEKFKNRS